MKSLALAALLAGVTLSSVALAQQPDFTSPSFQSKVAGEAWFRFGNSIEHLAEEHALATAAISREIDNLRAVNEQLQQRCGPPCSDIGKAGAR